MTLIAAISDPERNACYLIGDSTLSNPSGLGHDEPVQFPLVGDLNARFGKKGEYAATGHAQKLIMIRDDLVFAWSDRRSHAMFMVNRLAEAFKEKDSLTVEEFNKQALDLRNFDKHVDFIAAASIGGTYYMVANCTQYIIDGLGTVRAAGSGGQHLVKSLDLIDGTIGPISSNPTDVSTLTRALGYMGLAFLDQLTYGAGYGAGEDNGWGGIFECIYHDNGAFSRVSPIMWLFWTFVQEGDKEWKLIGLPIFSYQYQDGLSTASFSHAAPYRSQFVISGHPFETPRTFMSPRTFLTNTTINLVQFLSFEEERKGVFIDHCKAPDTEGVLLSSFNDRYMFSMRRIFQLKLEQLLPRGHRFVDREIWPQNPGQFDWVTPLLRETAK